MAGSISAALSCLVWSSLVKLHFYDSGFDSSLWRGSYLLTSEFICLWSDLTDSSSFEKAKFYVTEIAKHNEVSGTTRVKCLVVWICWDRNFSLSSIRAAMYQIIVSYVTIEFRTAGKDEKRIEGKTGHFSSFRFVARFPWNLSLSVCLSVCLSLLCSFGCRLTVFGLIDWRKVCMPVCLSKCVSNWPTNRLTNELTVCFHTDALLIFTPALRFRIAGFTCVEQSVTW